MATVFVDCGTAWITDMQLGTQVSTTFFVGWGEGTGVVSKGQFQINSEAQARVSLATSESLFNQVTWSAVMTASAVRSIAQAGMFANNSGGLIIVGDFAVLALQTNDRISFTITLTTT